MDDQGAAVRSFGVESLLNGFWSAFPTVLERSRVFSPATAVL